MLNPAGLIGCTSLPSHITYLCDLVPPWLLVYLKKQTQFKANRQPIAGNSKHETRKPTTPVM